MPIPLFAAAAEPLLASGLSEAAALTSSAFARRALQKQLMEAASKGAAAVGLGTGAAGLGELISPSKKKHEQSRMGSDANIDKDRIGKGGFDKSTAPKENKFNPKPNKQVGPRKSQNELNMRPGDTQTYDGGTLNPSEFGPATMGPGVGVERGNIASQSTFHNYEDEFPVETFNPPKAAMRKGLFGEDISQEDYDAMTQRNKDASFYGRFKKGGQVKKKSAKKASGGSVSSASKRGDGCCQRGKTKGRMV